MPTVGERLKTLRDAHGWSQSELARRAGVSQAYVWQIEAGIRGENLGLSVTRRLARALGVKPDELAPDGQDMPSEGTPEALAPIAGAA